MQGLHLIPHNTKINFVGMRFIAYAISLFIIVASIGGFFYKGLNFGIDFRGGYLFEVRMPDPVNVATLREELNQLGFGEVKLQEFGSPRDVLIRIERQKGGDDVHTQVVAKVKEKLGEKVDYRRIETVGPKVSEELISNGLWAVMVALVGMLIYIWFRFEWHFGLCGILALIHDSIAVLGFYIYSGYEFNETAFAAVLTTIGYSINDSVVIYDRLRENLRKYKKMPIPELINLTANETLSRTILTSGTTLMALVALYWFGGSVIENFSMPILVGIFVGTLSSIFLSANLLLYFDIRPKVKEGEGDMEAPQNA